MDRHREGENNRTGAFSGERFHVRSEMILPSALAERRSSVAADGENLFPIKPFGLRISAFSLPVKDSENAGGSRYCCCCCCYLCGFSYRAS